MYGDLTLKNVTITGGYSSAEEITGGTQPYTLARGGGLAVWGTATLENCTVSGNRVSGDENSSRDRGAYGGGIYANGLVLNNCVISGNSVIGYGAAGGGIYSVGGGDNTNGVGNEVTLTTCTISGNRVTPQHAYGGGLFTLGGGPNNLAWMRVTNCTIARVTFVNAGYTGRGVSTDDFLNHALEKVSTDYGTILGSDFGTSFGDLTVVTWYGPLRTWPSNPQNAAWITFWKDLDAAIGNRLGTVTLGDDFWGTFTAGPLGNNVTINVTRESPSARLVNSDQRGWPRPSGLLDDIGAIEKTQ